MSEDRGDRARRPRGRKPRRKVCTFCVDKIQHIDYKDIARLRRFTSADDFFLRVMKPKYRR